MRILSPSILTLLASSSLLEEGITRALAAGITTFHLDVMDGKFVEAKTFGPELLDRFKGIEVIKDVHLMVNDVEEAIIAFAKAGADIITFHLEAVSSEQEASRLIDLIHSYSIKAGVSIKPNTPISILDPFYERCDLILVMSVEPGKGGQSYIEESTSRIASIAATAESRHPGMLIEVDGGIDNLTAKIASGAGANMLVSGSYLFGKGSLPVDFEERVKGLLNL